jgi:hypothetical protein
MTKQHLARSVTVDYDRGEIRVEGRVLNDFYLHPEVEVRGLDALELPSVHIGIWTENVFVVKGGKTRSPWASRRAREIVHEGLAGIIDQLEARGEEIRTTDTPLYYQTKEEES